MKLINLSKKDEGYKLRALILFKFLGITIFTTEREFLFKENEKTWYTSKGKKVSDNKRIMLDKWLKDHKRFIE